MAITTTLVKPQVAFVMSATLTGSNGPSAGSVAINDQSTQEIAVGSGAGSADKEYSAAFVVTTGSPLVLDVTNLLDLLGGTINMLHVLAVKITNSSKTPGQDMTVGGGSNPLFAAFPITLKANAGASDVDFLGFHSPNPGIATSGSIKNIQISVAAGTSVPGNITILGRSA